MMPEEQEAVDIDPARLAYEAIAPVYDEFCAANDYEMWIGALLPALQNLGLRHGRLLDVGCGTGRAFEPMLGRGWEIVGCDLSSAMLGEARRKFGEAVPLHEVDVRKLPVLGRFELVWALNDVINYILEDGDLGLAFEAMKANLAPDGLILFDSNTLTTYGSAFDGATGVQRVGDWRWEGLTKGVAPGATFESRISGRDVEPHVHRERHYTEQQIGGAVGNAGLELLAALGQQEVDGKVSLTERADEERDQKIIHICRHRRATER